MSLLENSLRHGLPSALAADANHCARCRRYAGIRVVRVGVDLRIEYNAMLRGYLFGIECYAEALALLDEFRI